MSKKKVLKRKRKPETGSVDEAKEISSAQRLIEIGREQGYSINNLLTYELTSTYFLTIDGDYTTVTNLD